jgi:hypothetical protein
MYFYSGLLMYFHSGVDQLPAGAGQCALAPVQFTLCAWRFDNHWLSAAIHAILS